LEPNFSYKPLLIVVFPIIYLYFKNIVGDSKTFKPKELLHFVFPVLFNCFNLINNKIIIVNQHSSTIFVSIFAIYISTYTVMCFFLLKNNVWSRKTKILVINNQNVLLHKWTLFLFVLYLLSTIRLLLTLFIDWINNKHSSGENYNWINGIFFILALIKIWISPEILYGYNALYKKINEQKHSNFTLNEIWILIQKTELKNVQDNLLKEKVYANLTKYIKDIEHLVLEEKWFRNQKRSQLEIAEKLNITKSHLKFIFKYHSKVSFTEFIKIVKTYDAIQLMELGYLKTNKLDALALKVGFSSYNPFFTSFKEITGSTPQAYNKEILNIINNSSDEI